MNWAPPLFTHKRTSFKNTDSMKNCTKTGTSEIKIENGSDFSLVKKGQAYLLVELK